MESERTLSKGKYGPDPDKLQKKVFAPISTKNNSIEFFNPILTREMCETRKFQKNGITYILVTNCPTTGQVRLRCQFFGI